MCRTGCGRAAQLQKYTRNNECAKSFIQLRLYVMMMMVYNFEDGNPINLLEKCCSLSYFLVREGANGVFEAGGRARSLLYGNSVYIVRAHN